MILNAVIGLMGGYDPDAQAYFNQLTVQPSATYKTAVNTLVLQLKADSNFSKFDRFWIHATELQQHARVSLVNPTSTQLIEVNSPTWTASRGYTGNGSTQYIRTSYNTLSSSSQYTLNSSSIGIYSRTDNTSTGIEIGNFDSGVPNTFSQIRLKSGGIISGGVNDVGFITAISNPVTTGLFTFSRTGNTNIDLYRNGSLMGTNGTSANRLPNLEFYLLGRNSAGTANSFSNRQISISFIGAGTINNSTLYTAIQAFATTIGFNV